MYIRQRKRALHGWVQRTTNDGSYYGPGARTASPEWRLQMRPERDTTDRRADTDKLDARAIRYDAGAIMLSLYVVNLLLLNKCANLWKIPTEIE